MNKNGLGGLGSHFGNGHVDVGILLEFMKRNPKVSSFLDVGCGPGYMVDRFLDRGLVALGVDGDSNLAQAHDFIKLHNLSTSEDFAFDRNYEVAWATELLDQLDDSCLSGFFTLIEAAGCEWAIVTVAAPERVRPRTINCKNHEFWALKFSENDWGYEKNLTYVLKSKSWPMLCKPGGQISRSGAFESLMVFSKISQSEPV